MKKAYHKHYEIIFIISVTIKIFTIRIENSKQFSVHSIKKIIKLSINIRPFHTMISKDVLHYGSFSSNYFFELLFKENEKYYVKFAFTKIISMENVMPFLSTIKETNEQFNILFKEYKCFPCEKDICQFHGK